MISVGDFSATEEYIGLNFIHSSSFFDVYLDGKKFFNGSFAGVMDSYIKYGFSFNYPFVDRGFSVKLNIEGTGVDMSGGVYVGEYPLQ